MINEKNSKLEQAAAPAIGTVNAQDTTQNAPSCGKCAPKSKLLTSFKLSRELRIMIIKAELLIMEKYNTYSSGMNKELTQEAFEYYLGKSPYCKLKADESTPCSLIIRAAASCLYLCIEVKCDEMIEVFGHRNICECEHVFEDTLDVEEFRVEFSNSISGFTKTHYDYLMKLYPKAKDDAELVKLAFSDVLLLAARFTGKFDTHLSSAGSKKWAMQLLHWDMLQFIDEQKKVLVDVFARTASIALASMDIFDEIHCGDKDKRFVNFFEVLRNYPVALVLRLKSISTKFMKELWRLCCLADEAIDFKKIFNAFYEEINSRANKELHKASACVKIDAAVCLLLEFRFSFSGYGKDFNFEQASKFINRLDSVCNDLLYTSMVLTDKDNSRNIHKGIFKKTAGGLAYRLVSEPSKNTVSICPISYERWGFMKPILKNRDNPNCLMPLDCPYPRQFLFPCGDYKDEFGKEQLIKIFRALKGARCKAILFNSSNIDYKSIAERYVCRLVGTYKKKAASTEVTQIYSRNISSKEKFLDPKTHGGLY